MGLIQPTEASADHWRKIRIAKRILQMATSERVKTFARNYIGRKTAEIRRIL